ncbi:MAG: ribosomal subunit interface protein [Nitrospirae bacterium GWD2_57_9]|nr:MAG: ribosomal subunit interface protein [Nitrospirae bacterium GWD2_57_9]OGW48779.1 MAG: ribosomal subunit interface protein [Nitrospirae bacterium GWC2_57_9]
MQVTVVGRHIEATEALKQYATEKFSRLDKYLPKTVQVVITLSVVKKVHHIAEAVIKSNGLLIQASEETEEMYSAIDLLIEKIDRRVRRYKEKLVDHKHQSGKAEMSASSAAEPGERIPQIIKTKRFDLKPMLPEEAVMQMELLDKDFFIFANAGSGQVNVIYKRKDGNVGLIEPAR